VISIPLRADDVLRRRPWTTQSQDVKSAIAWLLAIIVLFGLLYGAVMGCFGGFSSRGLLQMLYSAVKVPLLLLASFAISLPSFFVVSTLLGLRSDFSQAVRALLATQGGLAIILASLAPFTALWYLSSANYAAAVTFNGVMFAVASFSSQWLLRSYYRPLVARNPRHRWLLRVWIVIYAFVAIQMAWILRPFIGEPGTAVQFFRDDVRSGDAYFTVGKLLWNALF